MHIFDGNKAALELETEISKQAAALREQGRAVKVAAILFAEDEGSKYYSEHKKIAAKQVGIDYELFEFSLHTPVSELQVLIQSLNKDPYITGIIIQKPTRRVWNVVITEEERVKKGKLTFDSWWTEIYSMVSPKKDVDGLHPSTAAAIQDGTWREKGRVLPATCRAVLKILASESFRETAVVDGKYILIGKSDLLGQPLFHVLKQQGREVEIIGRSEFAERMLQSQKLTDADVIITATGKKYLVTGEMIKKGVAIIDVGEPRPDVDEASIIQKAVFLTPVPGGVGPLTVISLLENAVKLASM